MILLFSAVIFVFGCKSPKGFIANMSGTWKGETSGEGVSFEQWNISDWKCEAYGRAWIIEESDTVFQEKFELVKAQTGYEYWAHPNLTDVPTRFKLKNVRKNYLEVENEHHDFPQVIIYYIQGNEVRITLKGENENHEKIKETYSLLRMPH